jgi:L-malate glycosyltransferase
VVARRSRDPHMKIGITCYPTYGGSGALATELGIALAARGHEVHFISYRQPFRLPSFLPGVYFHEVHVGQYPLFEYPPYDLALAVRMHEVVRQYGVELLHCHYAIPHATSAWIAREMLHKTGEDVALVTTLHGTDITLVGSDHSYAETVAFSIDASDGVTAVSESLRQDTYRTLSVRNPIAVIPNFLDCDVYKRVEAGALRAHHCPPGCEKLVIHVSNFRPVKRVPVAVEVFARIAQRVPSRLLLVGDGPELGAALDKARELGIAKQVDALGEQDQIIPLLSIADLFLLPSAQESFGLAALEAMACDVPVVASNVGGLHEVIDDGATGFLHAPDDIQAMADSGVRLLTDRELHARIARESRRTVRKRFCRDLVVPQYETIYEKTLRGDACVAPTSNA